MEINFLVAFTSGVVSFFAPCVVPLLPAYVGYITGVSLSELTRKGGIEHCRRQILWSSLAYVVGFSLVFTILGTSAAGLGSLFRQHEVLVQRGGGILIMLFALNFLGVLKLPGLSVGHQLRLPSWAAHLGYGRAFLVGVIFAAAWTPCVGAVLGAILTLAAASKSVFGGGALLFVYSLGISIPFLVIALTIAQAPAVLRSIERWLPVVSKVAGVVLLVIGFLLFNNTVMWISPMLTYNRLNSLLFEIAFKLGYQIR